MKIRLNVLALTTLTAVALSVGIGARPVSAALTPAAAAAFFGPCYDQPNMARALDHLRQARAALDHSEHNKDGWRDGAIQATDRAISETNRGCAMSNRR